MKYHALTDLLNDCSLPVYLNGSLLGSSFFVAPGYLLTCSHVIESTKDNPERLSFLWQSNEFQVRAVHLNFPKPYPDLALLLVDILDHPCVLLDGHADPWHELYSFGHTTKFPQGDPGTFELEGTGKIEGGQTWLKFKAGQVIAGFSGAPLLNLNTGAVCGIVSESRDLFGALGGHALPMEVIYQFIPELSELNRTFHATNTLWVNLQRSHLVDRKPDTSQTTQVIKQLAERSMSPGMLGMEDLFKIYRKPEEADEIFPTIFNTEASHGMAPYLVHYVDGRVGVQNSQKVLLDTLIDAGGMLLVAGSSGRGKTREVAELAKTLCNQGWIVCVAKIEGIGLVNRLSEFPFDKSDKLLLIFDDLHRWISIGAGGQKHSTERMEAFLAFIDSQIDTGNLRVIATTARPKEKYWNQLGFDPSKTPWRRFRVYDLPEFTQVGLQEILVAMCEHFEVAIDASEIDAMIKRSDKSLNTLQSNVDHARQQGVTLTIENWKDSLGASWKERFRIACGRYPAADQVYQALHLVREVGLPTQVEYVTQLSQILANNIETSMTVEGLVDFGMLSLRQNMLDAFSDEQLREILGEFPTVDQHLEEIIRASLRVIMQNQQWTGDLDKLFRKLDDGNKLAAAEKVVSSWILTHPTELYFRGRLKIMRGDYIGAEKDFSLSINLSQAHLTVKPKEERAIVVRSKFLEKVKGIISSFGRNRAEAVIYYFRGMARSFTGDFSGAEMDYTVAMDGNLDKAPIFLNRGLVRFIQGNYIEAEMDFTNAISLRPNDAFLYQFRCKCNIYLNRSEEAEMDFTEVQKMAPEDALTFVCRGDLHLTRGEYSLAIRSYKQALEKDGGRDWHFDLGLAFLLARRYTDARESYLTGLREGKIARTQIAIHALDYWTQRHSERLATDKSRQAVADIQSLLDRKIR